MTPDYLPWRNVDIANQLFEDTIRRISSTGTCYISHGKESNQMKEVKRLFGVLTLETRSFSIKRIFIDLRKERRKIS